jgi:hypothetical protein
MGSATSLSGLGIGLYEEKGKIGEEGSGAEYDGVFTKTFFCCLVGPATRSLGGASRRHGSPDRRAPNRGTGPWFARKNLAAGRDDSKDRSER